MKSAPLAPQAGNGQSRFPILLAIVIFASLSIWQAVAGEGFLEADGCTHYMYARWAFTYPVYFVDIWGRPLKTMLYAPAAATLGLIGVRLTSLAVAIGIAFVAYWIAKGQSYRWPALALIFTLAQPLLFLHSFSELTELPFALLLGLAFLAYQRRNWWGVTILAGLLPLGRPEGFGFVLLAAVLLACHRKWWLLPVLSMPVMGWQIAGAIMYREPQNWWNWLPKHWPYAGNSLYPKGPIWHFAALLPAVVGPALFPFTILGVWRTFARDDGGSGGGTANFSRASDSIPGRGVRHLKALLERFCSSHQVRVDFLIAMVPLMILTGHSVLHNLGKMASNGELRYMLVVAPFWALLAARGWEWVWVRLVSRNEGSTMHDESEAKSAFSLHPAPVGWWSPFRYAAVAAILPVFANYGYKVLPLVQTEDWKAAAKIAEWYKTSGVANDYPYIMAAHPGIAYALDWAFLDPRLADWSLANVDRYPPGTLLVWDCVYGEHNADRRKSVGFLAIPPQWIQDPVTLRRLLPTPDGWRPDWSGLIVPKWIIAFSPETIDHQHTAATQASPEVPEWIIKRW